MVGLGLVCAIATLGSSLQASFSSIISKTITADYVARPSNDIGGSPAAQAAVKNAPGVIAVSAERDTQFHESGTSHDVTGIDPGSGPQVFKLDMVTGSSNALAQGEMLVQDSTAKKRHLVTGDTLDIGFAQGGVIRVKVGGTYKDNQWLNSYVLPTSIVVANSTQDHIDGLFIKTATRDAAQQDALTKALSGFPDFTVRTVKQFVAQQKKRFTTFLSVAYVLLALSILIAAFSVVNTMALSVIERYREIGLLRAIGMGRPQVKGMIRSEAVIVAVLGAVLGMVLGVLLASAIVVAIGSSGALGTFHLVIPWPTLVIVLVLAGVIGVIAAVFPARRAARLDVLQAVVTV
jgi:putative ABC transport system permease protein